MPGPLPGPGREGMRISTPFFLNHCHNHSRPQSFRAFMMFSRTAFRLQGASKAIRSFSIAAEVNSYTFAASFPNSPVTTSDRHCGRPVDVTTKSTNETASSCYPFGLVRYRQHARYWT